MDLAIIGIDGLDPDLVETWQHELPTLSKLQSNGSFGRLKSTLPPLTAPAWSTFCTGKQGGKHSVFGFTRAKGEGYERVPVDQSDVRAETVWEALDSAGVSCGVANVPLTYPPTKLDNGFVVAGWPVPTGATITDPHSLINELEAELGTSYQVNPFPLTLEYEDLTNSELFERIVDGLWHHEHAFEYLASKNTDVFFAVFMAVDVASHNFAWDRERLLDVYVEQDRAFEELLGSLPDDIDLIVASDHGHGARGRRSFHVNEWLREEGYLTKADSTKPSLLGRLGLTQATYVRLKNYFGLGNVHEYLPKPVFNVLREVVPRDPDDVGSFHPEEIDWAQTLAFSCEQNQVFINDERFPEGSLGRSQAEELRDELAQRLATIPDPEGEGGLMSEVATKDDLFDGPFFGDAPDIVFIADEMKCNAPMGFAEGEIFTKERWGEHRQYGCLFTSGPSFCELDAAPDREIFDIFPLILGLTDVAIPENVDGSIPKDRLEVTIDTAFRPPRDEQHRQAVQRKPATGVREQLEGLGYLE